MTSQALCTIPGGEIWSGIVSALVIVEFHLQVTHSRVINFQSVAAVVDVLPIKVLKLTLIKKKCENVCHYSRQGLTLACSTKS